MLILDWFPLFTCTVLSMNISCLLMIINLSSLKMLSLIYCLIYHILALTHTCNNLSIRLRPRVTPLRCHPLLLWSSCLRTVPILMELLVLELMIHSLSLFPLCFLLLSLFCNFIPSCLAPFQTLMWILLKLLLIHSKYQLTVRKYFEQNILTSVLN